jgi:hypothetical protein
MRFLIFNLVVVGALFYLFAGGQPFGEADSNGMLGKVRGLVEKTVISGREATAAAVGKVTGDTKTRTIPQTTPQTTHGPKLAARLPENLIPPAIQVPAIQVPVRKAVPPRMAKLAAPTPPAIKDPAVRKRRDEVMATGPIASVSRQQKFMTPRQRRRELHALSEEMELLFASTRAR